MIKRKIGSVLGGLAAGALVLGMVAGTGVSDALATTIEEAPAAVEEASVEGEDVSSELEELPDTLTDEEMDDLTADMGNLDEGEFEMGVVPPRYEGGAYAAKKSPACKQDTGRIWSRTSGKGYPYGTIGGKPSITCNIAVTKISLSTNIYKKKSGHWKKVAGPFNNSNRGAKSLTQKSVEYVCKKATSKSHFRIVANGSVTYPGLKAIPGGAYSDTPNPGLTCG